LSLVFFTDRDLGLQFPTILESAGLTVQRHRDHFPHDCPDDVWLEAVGVRGWVALTHDGRIRYKPNELAAIVTHRVALLVIVGKATNAELARSFLATLNPVLSFLNTHPPPIIGTVYRSATGDIAEGPQRPGHVELWYPRP